MKLKAAIGRGAPQSVIDAFGDAHFEDGYLAILTEVFGLLAISRG